MKAMGALLMSLALLGCSAKVDSSAVDYDEVEVPVAQLSSDEARARGRALFRAKCALCHGERADGHGVRSNGAVREARELRQQRMAIEHDCDRASLKS